MSTNIILSIDQRKPKKDGTAPIILRVSHYRKTTAISTGYYIDPIYWDDSKKEVKKQYKGVSSVSRLNNVLYKRLADARGILVSLDDKEALATLSVVQLRSKIENASKSTSLTDYSNSLIDTLKELNKFGTARVYDTMLRALHAHSRKKNIGFNEINLAFLKSFETSFLKRGNSLNGLSAILRSLRAIINKAGEDGLYENDNSPFKAYKIKETPTAKRALSAESIQKIISLVIEKGHPCFDARNIFVLSYYLWGMNIKDMAYLKVSSIVDGRIRFERAKTHSYFDIKIQPVAAAILDFYTQGKEKDDFILPIIKRKAPAEQDKDVLWYRKRYNHKLRDLGGLCGIQERLTSYVSRHSFASNAESLEIPIQVISKMLGHSRISTTEIYLKGFSKNSIDSYHEQVVNSLR